MYLVYKSGTKCAIPISLLEHYLILTPRIRDSYSCCYSVTKKTG